MRCAAALQARPEASEKVGRDAEQPGPHLPEGRIEARSPPECDGKGLGGEVVREGTPDSASQEAVDVLEVRREGSLKRPGIVERASQRSSDVHPVFSLHGLFLSEALLTVA
jgi:hypothetical protein